MPVPLLLLLILSLWTCGPRPDLAADRMELLRMHELGQTAHLEKRADLLVASFADSMLTIASGEITVESPEHARAHFQAYFDRSTFLEWADIVPPRIRISPDGQMAYVVVQKRVRLTAPDSLGVTQPEHTVFAWVEMYEKRAGRWELMAVASTDRPGET
jgi:hypothetical protein